MHASCQGFPPHIQLNIHHLLRIYDLLSVHLLCIQYVLRCAQLLVKSKMQLSVLHNWPNEPSHRRSGGENQASKHDQPLRRLTRKAARRYSLQSGHGWCQTTPSIGRHGQEVARSLAAPPEQTNETAIRPPCNEGGKFSPFGHSDAPRRSSALLRKAPGLPLGPMPAPFQQLR